MAGVVGLIDVDIIRGVPEKLRTEMQTWRVPGLDGYGAMTIGQGDSEFNLTTILYVADNATAIAHRDAAIALQGTLITIDDDWENNYQNVLVDHVDASNFAQPVIKDGEPAVRCEIRFRMRST